METARLEDLYLDSIDRKEKSADQLMWVIWFIYTRNKYAKIFEKYHTVTDQWQT